jgi:hypothetical protein
MPAQKSNAKTQRRKGLKKAKREQMMDDGKKAVLGGASVPASRGSTRQNKKLLQGSGLKMY